MWRGCRTHEATSGRWPPRLRPGFLVLTGAAAALAGCMCLPAPAPTSGGVIGWAEGPGSDPAIAQGPAPVSDRPAATAGDSWRGGPAPASAAALVGDSWRVRPEAVTPAPPSGGDSGPSDGPGAIASGRRRLLAAGSAADAAIDRTSSVQEPPTATPIPPAPPPSRPAESEPSRPAESEPSRPAESEPSRSAELVPLGAGPAESTPAPAADLNVPAIPPAAEYPIDLPMALRLAERENPVIGAARAHIGEALARQQQARVELLPWLNAGVDYDGHAGNLQRSNGPILRTSRQALYLGGGAMTSASNTITVPAVSIQEPLADALFDPLAAHQRVHQARFDASATAHAVLLEVASYYLELLGATARLEADRRSAAEAAELMRITERYARTGEGRPADFHRAQTEWRIQRAAVRRAEEEQAIAAARLSRRLHLDPSIRIRPLSNALEILALVDLNGELPALIATALRRRPEVQSAGADLAATAIRLKQAIARPFLPTLYLGFSGGVFGGGSNQVPPLLGHFGGRTDFDVVAFWTLENLGLGNLAQQKQGRARVGEATGRQARAINLVREQVAAAYGEARAAREQVELARAELATATDGFRRDLERARQAVPDRPGRTPRPIEVINSLKLLIEARRKLIRTIVDYDRAQFRLFVAMGSPPPLEQPVDPSSPAVSIASLAAPVAGGPNPASPPQPGPGASAVPDPARRDRPDQPIERALAAAASDLARTLERLQHEAGRPGAPRDRFAGLAKAHQKSMGALLEYDRVQEKLFQSFRGGPATAHPAEQVDQLMELAKAHRKLLKSKVEYDEALWGLLRTLQAKAPAGAGASGPSITRREPKDAGPSAK